MRVAVLGAGQGGLAAAAAVAGKGHDVTLFEKSAIAGGKAGFVKANGYTFDPGPSIIIMPWIYEEFFTSVGKQMGDYLKFGKLENAFSIRTEKGEDIDLPTDVEEFVKLMSERFNEDPTKIRAFIDMGKHIYPLVKRTVFKKPIQSYKDLMNLNFIRMGMKRDLLSPFKELVDNYFTSDLAKAFFYGFPSYSGSDYHSPLPSGAMIPYIMLTEGVYYPVGGVGAIPEAFYKLGKDLGVRHIFNKEIGMIRKKGEQMVIRFSDGSESEFDRIISNIDRTTTERMMGRELKERKPSFSYYTLQIGYKGKFPIQKHHLMLIPEDYQSAYDALYESKTMPEKPLIYVNIPSATDPSCAPEGSDNIFFVIYTPSIVPTIDWARYEENAVEYIFKNLENYGIHLDPELIEFKRVQSPRYFQREHGNFMGTLFGASNDSWVMKKFPMSNYDEEFKEIFYVGGAVQPGAGLPMVTLSGKWAGSWVE